MQTRHILPLTGIRFFAASWVVLCHFHGYLLPLFPGLAGVGRICALGYQAVPLFFILSGFILSYNHFADYSLSLHPKFIFQRFARLWPVHVVTLALVAVGPALLQLNLASARSFVEELLMIRSWFHTDLAWNYPAWSISAEWFAYIFIFPLAFYLFKRIRSWAIALALVALCLAAQVYLPMPFLPGRCDSIVFLFLAGSGLYRLFELVKNPPAEMITMGGTLLFIGYLCFTKYLPGVALYAAFALLIYGLAYERGVVAKALSTKLIVRGGLISYSLYMTHAFVIRNYLFYFWDHEPRNIFLRCLVVLGVVAALIGVAAVFYYFIEEPANRKLRRLWRPPAFRPVEAPAATRS